MRVDLAGRVAWITGAGQGIGRGIALGLAAAGADIVVNDLASGPGGDNPAAYETAQLVRALGRQARVSYADVAEAEQVEAVVADAVAVFGRLDIAVANAAFSVRELVVASAWPDVERTIAVTQFGVFHTCRAAARRMIAQGHGGKIVIIGSIMADMALPMSAAYNMAKAAVNQFGRTLAEELAPHRINVNVVNPGYIDTPGERRFADEAAIARAGRAIPWGRIGTPADIGHAVTFLCSEAADYITGSALRVDGGFLGGLRLPPAPETEGQ
ncbi:MAG: SDR family oxidoreductase [Oscillochloris sp.]|nr:SDR family oxidoreductase [Oscillochloris sp.]